MLTHCFIITQRQVMHLIIAIEMLNIVSAPIFDPLLFSIHPLYRNCMGFQIGYNYINKYYLSQKNN
jgi:hypothetical protein